MYSHITLGTSRMNRAMRFYDAVLAPLGMKRKRTFKIAVSYAPPDFSGVNEPFWVVRPDDKQDATPGNGVTVAFEAPTRAAVDAFHVAALAAGATDEGRPGIRAHDHGADSKSNSHKKHRGNRFVIAPLAGSRKPNSRERNRQEHEHSRHNCSA